MEIEKIKQHIDDVLVETNFTNLGEKKVGKVRDIYITKDRITLISTDRLSVFDRNVGSIPFKGEVLNKISLFWFDKTKDIMQNHVLGSPDANVLIAKKCQPILLEIIVRGYLSGASNTSLWTLYKAGQRDFEDFTLPEGMRKNQKLAKPVLTPTTKSNKHDETIYSKEIIGKGIVSPKLWEEISEKAIKLFILGQSIALSRGFILVDTKYEFGLDENGKLMLIDEIHTPDCSRYWNAGSYESNFNQGLEPKYLDKEFIRLWFRDNCDPYKDEIMPKAPVELVAELSRRYIQIFEQITGKPFEHDFSQSTLDRITNNLSKL